MATKYVVRARNPFLRCGVRFGRQGAYTLYVVSTASTVYFVFKKMLRKALRTCAHLFLDPMESTRHVMRGFVHLLSECLLAQWLVLYQVHTNKLTEYVVAQRFILYKRRKFGQHVHARPCAVPVHCFQAH